MRILIFSLFFALFSFANELNFDSLQGKFTQIIKSKDSSIEYSGTFTLQNLGEQKALWNYFKPNPKTVYFSSSKVTIIEPDLEQVIITKLDKTPNLTVILNNAQKTGEDGIYKAKFDDTIYTIKFSNSLPQNIYYTDKLDNEVSINLSEVSKNLAIDASIFEPNIPSNFDIINQ
ncbi:MAG: LolA-like outer membrane lipoprotein chaperone [Campylobacter sp.]|nr:LolA-like outer membrane lipoprotein chaperone [Campylobacter sp.]